MEWNGGSPPYYEKVPKYSFFRPKLAENEFLAIGPPKNLISNFFGHNWNPHKNWSGIGVYYPIFLTVPKC